MELEQKADGAAAAAADQAPATPDPWSKPYTFVLLAVWFGLLLGFTETTLREILYALHRCRLDFVTSAYWTPPASTAIIFAVPGLVLWLVVRHRLLRLKLRGVMWLCGLPFFIALVITVSRLFLVRLFLPALILLALGLAAQAARIASRHPRGFYRLVLWSTAALVLLDAGVAVATLGGAWWRERSQVSELAPARPDAPNVLLLVLDTVRAKSMSLYGYDGQTTPHLEQWARQGVVFDRAVATSPWTAPSHASMFTGRDAHELSIDWCVPLQPTHPTLAEAMSANGYRTGGFVSNYWMAGHQTKLDRGFAHYYANPPGLVGMFTGGGLSQLVVKPPLVEAHQINARFLQWLPHDRNRPFFAFLNYLDCHAPYLSGSRFSNPEQPYTRKERGLLERLYTASLYNPNLPSEHVMLAEDAYNGCLRKLDREVDALLTELERRGDLENTFVIIVSDHGEQFGEHDLVEHSNSLYRPLLHVPLIILGPRRVAAGKRVSQMVSLRDLPATILELVDLNSTGIPGGSFAGHLLENSTPEPSKPMFASVSKGIHYPEWFPNGRNPLTAVFLDHKHYIRRGQEEELFDFETDPLEERNLIGSDEFDVLLERCRQFVPERVNTEIRQ